MAWMKWLLKLGINFEYPVKVVGVTIIASKISHGFNSSVDFTGNLLWIIDNDFVELLSFVTEC